MSTHKRGASALLAFAFLAASAALGVACKKKAPAPAPPVALADGGVSGEVKPPVLVRPLLPEPKMPDGWPRGEVHEALGRHVRCHMFESGFDVLGWTKDGRFFAYRSRMTCFNPTTGMSSGSFSYDIGVVVDPKKGTRARYVVERDGDTSEARTGRIGTLVQWEKWKQDHPTFVNAAQETPDKKRRARITPTEVGGLHAFTPTITLDEKPFVTLPTATCPPAPPVCEAPAVEAHWSPTGEYVAWPVTWPWAKRPDGSTATLSYMIVAAAEPKKPAK